MHRSKLIHESYEDAASRQALLLILQYSVYTGTSPSSIKDSTTARILQPTHYQSLSTHPHFFYPIYILEVSGRRLFLTNRLQ